MFEIGIISIIVLAVGYWVTLWLMSRHDDVLHGHFVHAEDGAEASGLPDPSLANRPPLFPPKPVIKRSRLPLTVANPVTAKPAAAKPAAVGTPSTSSPAASSTPSPPRADHTDKLQALLASIKRDLKDASQL